MSSSTDPENLPPRRAREDAADRLRPLALAVQPPVLEGEREGRANKDDRNEGRRSHAGPVPPYERRCPIAGRSPAGVDG